MLNKQIVAKLQQRGNNAMGVTGADGDMSGQDDTRGRRSNRRGRNLFIEKAELLPECLPANAMESLTLALP